MSSHSQPGEDSKGPVVFCDFDGTITQVDVTDQILAQLAHPSWREIEREWMLGLIGSRECLERQIALVDAPAEELHAVIDAVTLDPDFTTFCKFARKQRLPLYILSDGFDYVIRRVLKGAGVDRHFRSGANLFANLCGRWHVGPFRRGGCRRGLCQTALAGPLPGERHRLPSFRNF
ncbi:MAG: HAD-IB family phosphatase [Terriglobia bacterium]